MPSDHFGRRGLQTNLPSVTCASSCQMTKCAGFAFGLVCIQMIAATAKHFSGIFADITEQKAAETEAALQRQEVAHLMRVSVLGELSGAIAHEVNQPLTAILSNAQAALHLLAQNSPNLAEVRDALQDIVHEDNRAGEVIHRLRSLLKKGEQKFGADRCQ